MNQTADILNSAIEQAQEKVKKAVEQLMKGSIDNTLVILSDISAILDLEPMGKTDFTYEINDLVWVWIPNQGKLAGVVRGIGRNDNYMVDLVAGPNSFNEHIVVCKSRLGKRKE